MNRYKVDDVEINEDGVVVMIEDCEKSEPHIKVCQEIPLKWDEVEVLAAHLVRSLRIREKANRRARPEVARKIS